MTTSRSGTTKTKYNHEFAITLSDKSTVALVIETEEPDGLRSAPGIRGTLYEGCRSSYLSKKLVLDMYPHTHIITDARIV